MQLYCPAINITSYLSNKITSLRWTRSIDKWDCIWMGFSILNFDSVFWILNIFKKNNYHKHFNLLNWFGSNRTLKIALECWVISNLRWNRLNWTSHTCKLDYILQYMSMNFRNWNFFSLKGWQSISFIILWSSNMKNNQIV